MLSYATYAVRHTIAWNRSSPVRLIPGNWNFKDGENNMSAIRNAAGKVALTAVAAFTIITGAIAGPVATANAADDSCANVEVVFARGVADATNRIESIAASCPATKIVIGGYSQGAAVAGYSTMSSVPAGFVLPAGISGPMPASVASHVAAVVLFGTPSPFVLSVADRSAPAINIGGAYAGKTIQLCAPGDPICGGGMDRSAHSAYKFNGMANQAADFVARQLGAPAAPVAPMIQTSDDTAN